MELEPCAVGNRNFGTREQKMPSWGLVNVIWEINKCERERLLREPSVLEVSTGPEKACYGA